MSENVQKKKHCEILGLYSVRATKASVDLQEKQILLKITD